MHGCAAQLSARVPVIPKMSGSQLFLRLIGAVLPGIW